MWACALEYRSFKPKNAVSQLSDVTPLPSALGLRQQWIVWVTFSSIGIMGSKANSRGLPCNFDTGCKVRLIQNERNVFIFLWLYDFNSFSRSPANAQCLVRRLMLVPRMKIAWLTMFFETILLLYCTIFRLLIPVWNVTEHWINQHVLPMQCILYWVFSSRSFCLSEPIYHEGWLVKKKLHQHVNFINSNVSGRKFFHRYKLWCHTHHDGSRTGIQ